MLKIYGSMLCKDCVRCREELDRAGVGYEFLDFAQSLQSLKDFLKLRETSSLFDPVKEAGCIGIPCIVDEEGKLYLSWERFLPM